METRRWLLPFAWGMDMQAIDAAVRLADGSGATLVAVSLISRSEKPGNRGVRLEHIQQSKDFLEAINWKATRFNVSLERHEVFTVDVMQSITTLVHELHCDALVLVSQAERETLLRSHQLKRILEDPPASLLVLRLSSRAGRQSTEKKGPGARALSWLRRRIGGQHSTGQAWETSKLEGPFWVRSEEHRRS